MKKLEFRLHQINRPIEFLSLSNEKGIGLQHTVSEFGPVLFSKILGLNDTQAGVMAVVLSIATTSQCPFWI